MSDRNTPGLKGRRPESRPSFFQCLATWAWELSWPGNNSDCWLWTGPMLGVLCTLSHLILTQYFSGNDSLWLLPFVVEAIEVTCPQSPDSKEKKSLWLQNPESYWLQPLVLLVFAFPSLKWSQFAALKFYDVLLFSGCGCMTLKVQWRQ